MNLGCVVDAGIQQLLPVTHLEEVKSGLENLHGNEPSTQKLVDEKSGNNKNNFHPLVIHTFGY